MEIIISALKSAFSDFIWTYAGVSGIFIFVGSSWPLQFKTLFFIVGFVVLFAVYICVCLVVHKIRLRNTSYFLEYNNGSEKEKGKTIGHLLSGW